MDNNSSEKNAFVMGFTGGIGQEVLKALAREKLFAKVVLIGRRKVEFDDEELKTWEQRIVDFDNLSKHTEDFKDLHVGFCSLGTTRAKAGKEGFYKIDHDYVLESAKLAKDGGCEEFHYVSSAGADKSSMFFYLKTKAEIEDDLSKVGFNRLSIYRPKMLLGKRDEARMGERVAKFLLKPIVALSPTALSVPMEDVAKAMLNNSKKSINESVEILDNVACHNLSKEGNSK
ncbi:DgyrCDS12806 [Dimorphilus gyrociliatus]|uniref:Protein HTATIP2 n=1 Tax=Dimorphilus gyrociliatus TaxID=2664684 RepID=A0A7I8W8T9_9ANNE|nr:DgyrCDS12806 [Dimorphilus gyrociliatus]